MPKYGLVLFGTIFFLIIRFVIFISFIFKWIKLSKYIHELHRTEFILRRLQYKINIFPAPHGNLFFQTQAIGAYPEPVKANLQIHVVFL